MGLKKLLVTEQEVTEELLEQILSGYALLAGDTRRVVFTPAGAVLNARAKILLALAARHAWRFLSPGEEQDVSMTVSDLEAQTGLTGNTLRPALKSLKDQRIIENPRPRQYRLPPHNLISVHEELNKIRAKDQGSRT